MFGMAFTGSRLKMSCASTTARRSRCRKSRAASALGKAEGSVEMKHSFIPGCARCSAFCRHFLGSK